MVGVGRVSGKYFKVFSNKYGKIIIRSLCIGMNIKPMTPKERLQYLINRYNEIKSIREKEKINPSPDHKGKMKVIKIELNRLCYEMCLATGKIAREEYLEKKKKLFDVE